MFGCARRHVRRLWERKEFGEDEGVIERCGILSNWCLVSESFSRIKRARVDLLFQSGSSGSNVAGHYRPRSSQTKQLRPTSTTSQDLNDLSTCAMTTACMAISSSASSSSSSSAPPREQWPSERATAPGEACDILPRDRVVDHPDPHDNHVSIVAEIGINHNGDMDICKQLMRIAKEAGADYAKIQKRNPDVCVPEAQKKKMRETPWVGRICSCCNEEPPARRGT